MRKLGGADLTDETSVPSRLRRAIIHRDLLMVKSITAAYPQYLQNPNYNDKSNTSLHLAAAMGDIEIVKHLVSLGHDSCTPNVLSSGYDSAPGISVNADWSTPLHLAASHAHTECVDFLCKTFPQTIDRRDKTGATPLMLAARSSGPGTNAANLNAARSTNLVPPAAQRPRSASSPPEDTGAVVTLLMHKASVGLKDKAGNTALHYASAWGNLKTFRLLVSAGVPPLEENDGGWTAADYACTLAAARYCRALVEEFEGLKSGEPPLMKPQVPLKLRVHDLSSSSGGEERSSPVSPADTLRSGSGKLGLTIVKTGSASTSTTTLRPGGEEEGDGEREHEEDESSDEEVPLTARKISISDEDPFGSFSGSYGNDR